MKAAAIKAGPKKSKALNRRASEILRKINQTDKRTDGLQKRLEALTDRATGFYEPTAVSVFLVVIDAYSARCLNEAISFSKTNNPFGKVLNKHGKLVLLSFYALDKKYSKN